MSAAVFLNAFIATIAAQFAYDLLVKVIKPKDVNESEINAG